MTTTEVVTLSNNTPGSEALKFPSVHAMLEHVKNMALLEPRNYEVEHTKCTKRFIGLRIFGKNILGFNVRMRISITKPLTNMV